MRHRRALAVAVIVAFTVFIVAFVAMNPEILRDVVSIGWRNLLILLALYCGVVLTHFGILQATIMLCGASLPAHDGLLLTVYSTVANFFGPLQSGPGVRAVYLKARIGLRFRDYTYATLLYYFVFAAVNASLLFARSNGWLTALGLIAAALIVAVAVWRLKLASRCIPLLAICLITVGQVLLMSTVYFVELTAVSDGSITAVQALSFSASANLSLFVSLTPGAIGIREAFLVFAEALHLVPLPTIVAAGIVDRAFYIVFLGALFLASSAMNLGSMFKRKA